MEDHSWFELEGLQTKAFYLLLKQHRPIDFCIQNKMFDLRNKISDCFFLKYRSVGEPFPSVPYRQLVFPL